MRSSSIASARSPLPTRSCWSSVTSAHRGDAFDACRFLMDYLKTRAPFWKKETTPQGTRWVDARASDDEAAARWDETLGAPR